MPAPKASLQTSGTNPVVSSVAFLEAMVNAVAQSLYTAAEAGDTALRAEFGAGDDALRAEIGAIVNGLSLAGNWDASAGSFPSGAVLGTYYVVTGAGSVNGQAFAVGDWLLPLVAAPSTSTYAGNWARGDYSKVLPKNYASVPAFKASLEGSRGAGTVWEGGGFRYEQLVAGTAGNLVQVSNAAGILFKVLPGPDGLVPVEALGLDDTGATDVTQKMQAALDSADGLLVPAGTFWARLVTSGPKTIIGVDRARSIITSEANTSGTTLTVGGNLFLSDLTIKCHPTEAGSKTILHTGAYTVTAHNTTFTGTNHSPAAGVNAAGDYKHCLFHTTAQPAGLGALCWSQLARFTYCRFTGGRTVEARSSKFYFCEIGDPSTHTAVHIPDGATLNDGTASGYDGKAEFWDCIVKAATDGITEGNEGKALLRRTTVKVGNTGLYSRSRSTFDIEDSHIESTGGTAVSFSDAAGPGAIARAGESVIKRSTLVSYGTLSANKALAVPTTAEAYPASIGNVILTDCEIVGGDDEISPNTSNYHIFKSERSFKYSTNVEFTADGQTKKLRYKGDGMLVRVYGTDAAKTGCFLSHLDLLTGQPLPDGTRIFVRYGGVSSRFVTFASGNTADGGQMYFRGNAATWQADQQGISEFYLQGTAWRQV